MYNIGGVSRLLGLFRFLSKQGVRACGGVLISHSGFKLTCATELPFCFLGSFLRPFLCGIATTALARRVVNPFPGSRVIRALLKACILKHGAKLNCFVGSTS